MSLGRGLGALITPTIGRQKKEYSTGSKDNTVRPPAGKIWEVPVSEITAASKQPRQYFDPAELDNLASSVKKFGILQPLLLSEKKDGGYEIVAGERRWRAAKLAGLMVVPAIVKALKDQEKLEIALIENIQREDLNPIEEAFAYKRLIEEFKLTQQEVSDRVGKSRPAVANSVRLLELPAPAQQALIEKKINSGQARAILSLETDKERLDALSSILGQKISVREMEQRARVVRSGGWRKDPNLTFLEEKLRKALGTRVAITQKGDKGTISINYFSKEELAKLIKMLIGE